MLIPNEVNVFQWVIYIKKWRAYVSTPSDFATLLRHNTTKRLPTPALLSGINKFLPPFLLPYLLSDID